MNSSSRARQAIIGSLEGNRAVSFTVGEGKGAARRRSALADFLVAYAATRNGIHLSSDGKGVMIAYRSDVQTTAWREWLLQARLVVCAIGWRRLWRVLRRNQEIHRHQRKWGTFIHCWYIGVTGTRDGTAARELQHRLFAWSDASGLPVLAETTMEKNRRAYEFIGFIVYARVHSGSMTTWLLVRNPNR